MTRAYLRIVPLGGLGHIGGNMMALETDDDLVLIDAGILFGDDTTPGIDCLVPDVGYAIERQAKFRGYVITHGHEDHIGALPFLQRQLPGPIFAGGFTAALIRKKMAREKRKDYDLREYRDFEHFSVGGFGIEAIPTTHSIPGACSLVFDTPIGKVMHSGDFKIDRQPMDGRGIGEARLRALGDEGLRVLLSDSTNSSKTGWTFSESEVVEPLIAQVKNTYGRCYITLFSSNLFRVEAAFRAAEASGRKILVAGRNLAENIVIAQDRGLLNLRQDLMVDDRQAKDMSKQELLILISGSQGEPRSALTRIARGEHRDLTIEPGDVVIFSSRKIPGNEKAVGRLQNALARLGAEIVDDRAAKVHTSGHAFADEQRTLVEWTRPEWFVPIHGEFRHLIAHAATAKGAGVSGSKVVIVEDGMAIEMHDERGELEVEVVSDESASGLYFLQGNSHGDAGGEVLRQRRRLAAEGLVVGHVSLDARGNIEGEPRFEFRGCLETERYEHRLESLIDATYSAFDQLKRKANHEEREEALRLVMRRFFKKHFYLRPELVALVSQGS